MIWRFHVHLAMNQNQIKQPQVLDTLHQITTSLLFSHPFIPSSQAQIMKNHWFPPHIITHSESSYYATTSHLSSKKPSISPTLLPNSSINMQPILLLTHPEEFHKINQRHCTTPLRPPIPPCAMLKKISNWLWSLPCPCKPCNSRSSWDCVRSSLGWKMDQLSILFTDWISGIAIRKKAAKVQ